MLSALVVIILLISSIRSVGNIESRNSNPVIIARLLIIYLVYFSCEFLLVSSLAKFSINLTSRDIWVIFSVFSLYSSQALSCFDYDGDVSWTLQEYRNYILAPLAEELLFKRIILFLTASNFYQTSLLFGISHAHNCRSIPQLVVTFTYTFLFSLFTCAMFGGDGVLASFILHAVCNYFGLPTWLEQVHFGLIDVFGIFTFLLIHYLIIYLYNHLHGVLIVVFLSTHQHWHCLVSRIKFCN